MGLELLIGELGDVIVRYAVPTYTITASAGSGGAISPNGVTTLNQGDSQTYTITPNGGFLVTDVAVDGGSIGATTTYTFSSVSATHTISATFAAIPSTGGTVSQVGNYIIHTFTSGGTFTPSIPVTADVLVVGGGGGGGGTSANSGYYGGAGGAGGFVTSTIPVSSST